MPFYVFVALSVFLISLLGTRLMILALRKRTIMMDVPSLRSNHVTPTPRGGGIAVVMAIVIGLLLADVDQFGIMLSVFLLAAVSLLDDLISVPIIFRLIVQLMAVCIPLSMIHEPLFEDYLPMWLDKTIIAVLWLWFINLFNFMDGIDGISAAEMVSIGTGVLLLCVITGVFPNALSMYGLVIATAGCGFVWWNWHPAKIFLGDVGSIPIGFLLGYMLLEAAMHGYGLAVLILPAYYLSDGTITILKRLWQGKKIWAAHSEHYYQQAVRSGKSHDTVVRIILGINLLLILLATLSALYREIAIFDLAMAYMTVFMTLGFFADKKTNTKNAH